MDEDHLRAAQTEAAFRATNERHPSARLLGYICECADENCHASIRLSEERYQAVRSNPRQFFMAPGHERACAAEVGTVVERDATYVIVEKDGPAARVAEQSQP